MSDYKIAKKIILNYVSNDANQKCKILSYDGTANEQQICGQ